jgi:hypothetical protein
MKHALILFLFLFSEAAAASKSRLDTLARSPHLIDSQSVYSRPLGIFELDPYFALESGVSSPVGLKDGAEASVLLNLPPNSRLSFSYGHQEDLVVSSRLFLNGFTGTNLPLTHNPVHIFYGYRDEDTNYVVSVSYSQLNDKVTLDKESSSHVSAGVEMGSLQLFGSYVAVDTAESGGVKHNGAGGGSANVFYNLDSTTFYFSWSMTRAKSAVNAVERDFHTVQTGQLGFVDSKIKEERDYFWGGQVMTMKVDCYTLAGTECSDTFTRTRVPVWFGIEGQMEPWLVLRASITQNFLVDQIKDEVGYPAAIVPGANGAVSDVGAGYNSSVVGFGAGLKFGNLIVDGSFTAATTQTVNQNSFLTQSAITYNF